MPTKQVVVLLIGQLPEAGDIPNLLILVESY